MKISFALTLLVAVIANCSAIVFREPRNAYGGGSSAVGPVPVSLNEGNYGSNTGITSGGGYGAGGGGKPQIGQLQNRPVNLHQGGTGSGYGQGQGQGRPIMIAFTNKPNGSHGGRGFNQGFNGQRPGHQSTNYGNAGGHQPTGYGNSGNQQTGFKNPGLQPTGFGNSGLQPTGYGNSGNQQTGFKNPGLQPTGFGNSGLQPTGYGNSGNQQTGFKNQGLQPTGFGNSGLQPNGYGNPGHQQTGYGNVGGSDQPIGFGNGGGHQPTGYNAGSTGVFGANMGNKPFSSGHSQGGYNQQPFISGGNPSGSLIHSQGPQPLNVGEGYSNQNIKPVLISGGGFQNDQPQLGYAFPASKPVETVKPIGGGYSNSGGGYDDNNKKTDSYIHLAYNDQYSGQAGSADNYGETIPSSDTSYGYGK